MKYDGIYQACNHITSGKELKLIVDLGARYGEGYYSFGKNHPEASYVFVEPSNRCITKLIEITNREKRTTLIDGVLSDEDGFIDFFQLENDNDQSGNLFSDRMGIYGSATKCVVKTYDFRKVFDEKIDFVKCNIEGGEYQLIEQGFFSKVNSFVMEVHNVHVKDKTYRDAVKLLGSEFDLELWGNISYKYCFLNGVRK